MRSETSFASTGTPSIAAIRSPARRPAAAAGESERTASTVVVAAPPPLANRIANRTRERTMFANGPAAIAASRFHVFARQ
jgi:hypothetical protein